MAPVDPWNFNNTKNYSQNEIRKAYGRRSAHSGSGVFGIGTR